MSTRLLGITLLALAVWPSAGAFGASNSGWDFIDTQSGAPAALLREPRTLIIGGQGIAISFCAKREKFHCFVSEIFSFYVPKQIGSSRQWVGNGRLYCLVREYNSGNSGEKVNLIMSKTTGACEDAIPFDMSYVYSETYGLRLMTKRLDGGGIHEFYSIDRYGFGSP